MTYADQINAQNAGDTTDWFFDLPLSQKFERTWWMFKTGPIEHWSLVRLLLKISFSELWLTIWA
jgi:hypothetical protein